MEKKFSVTGMKCAGCEGILEEGLAKEKGVEKSKADFSRSSLSVSFEESRTSAKRIREAAKGLGYELSEVDVSSNGGSSISDKLGDFLPVLALLAVFAFAYFIVYRFFGGFSFPAPGSNVALASVFAVGLFTGLHCIGMCGGFVASAAKGGQNSLGLYLGGKLISYTAIGALLGMLGGVVMIGTEVRAALAILAGMFMVIFGLSSLGVGIFRQLYASIPKLHVPIPSQAASAGPFALGLLNGFMPCGPLQAMQLYALSTGSPVAGGLVMLVFGAGTIPFMAGFGAILTKLAASSAAMLSRASSIVVIFLGVSLLWNGWITFADNSMPSQGTQASLVYAQAAQKAGVLSNSGGAATVKTASGSDVGTATAAGTTNSGYVQTLRISVYGYGYDPQVLQAKPNTKTRLIIDAKELTGCNRQFQIKSQGIFIDLKKGENVVEFTTGEDGSTIDFACGMNMLKGQILVTGDSAAVQQAAAKAAAAPKKSGCGCGG